MKPNLAFEEEFLTEELADKLLRACDGLNCNDSRRSNITFGDPGLIYTTTIKNKIYYKKTRPWEELPILEEIKQAAEEYTGENFNCCAIMCYPTGDIVIKRHRDKEMVAGTIICGVCVGSTRSIMFTHQRYDPVILDLPHGCLYAMLSPTNDYWTHEILAKPGAGVRYSLTFRNFQATVKEIPYCPAIVKSGKRQGQNCGNQIHDFGQTVCGIHNKK